jgi:hypothetical protein
MRGVIRVTLGLAPPQSRSIKVNQETINGNQWQSVAINGNQAAINVPGALRGQSASGAIDGNQWQSMAIKRQSMYQGHFEANPHRGQLGGARV